MPRNFFQEQQRHTDGGAVSGAFDQLDRIAVQISQIESQLSQLRVRFVAGLGTRFAQSDIDVLDGRLTKVADFKTAADAYRAA